MLPWHQTKGFHSSASCWTVEEVNSESGEEVFHTIIKNTERSKGDCKLLFYPLIKLTYANNMFLLGV